MRGGGGPGDAPRRGHGECGPGRRAAAAAVPARRQPTGNRGRGVGGRNEGGPLRRPPRRQNPRGGEGGPAHPRHPGQVPARRLPGLPEPGPAVGSAREPRRGTGLPPLGPGRGGDPAGVPGGTGPGSPAPSRAHPFRHVGGVPAPAARGRPVSGAGSSLRAGPPLGRAPGPGRGDRSCPRCPRAAAAASTRRQLLVRGPHVSGTGLPRPCGAGASPVSPAGFLGDPLASPPARWDAGPPPVPGARRCPGRSPGIAPRRQRGPALSPAPKRPPRDAGTLVLGLGLPSGRRAVFVGCAPGSSPHRPAVPWDEPQGHGAAQPRGGTRGLWGD